MVYGLEKIFFVLWGMVLRPYKAIKSLTAFCLRRATPALRDDALFSGREGNVGVHSTTPIGH